MRQAGEARPGRAYPRLEMQVRIERIPAAADSPDLLAAVDRVVRLQAGRLFQVGVQQVQRAFFAIQDWCGFYKRAGQDRVRRQGGRRCWDVELLLPRAGDFIQPRLDHDRIAVGEPVGRNRRDSPAQDGLHRPAFDGCLVVVEPVGKIHPLVRVI